MLQLRVLVLHRTREDVYSMLVFKLLVTTEQFIIFSQNFKCLLVLYIFFFNGLTGDISRCPYVMSEIYAHLLPSFPI